MYQQTFKKNRYLIVYRLASVNQPAELKNYRNNAFLLVKLVPRYSATFYLEFSLTFGAIILIRRMLTICDEMLLNWYHRGSRPNKTANLISNGFKRYDYFLKLSACCISSAAIYIGKYLVGSYLDSIVLHNYSITHSGIQYVGLRLYQESIQIH